MKKLLAIICILFVIFIGMYIYKTNINQTMVTVSEVEKIEEYISKIYMWKEVTKEALPKFDNVNDAPDLWIWEVVKKNLENYELSYEEIQEEAIQIFGTSFAKQFPKEGTEYIYYSEEYGRYLTTGIGLDTLEDLFFIKEINKKQNAYEVQIVEYLEDYSEAMIANSNENQDTENEEIEYNIYIKNLELETIATIKSTEGETRAIETVKENIDKFSSKTVNLAVDSNGEIFVESVK